MLFAIPENFLRETQKGNLWFFLKRELWLLSLRLWLSIPACEASSFAHRSLHPHISLSLVTAPVYSQFTGHLIRQIVKMKLMSWPTMMSLVWLLKLFVNYLMVFEVFPHSAIKVIKIWFTIHLACHKFMVSSSDTMRKEAKAWEAKCKWDEKKVASKSIDQLLKQIMSLPRVWSVTIDTLRW